MVTLAKHIGDRVERKIIPDDVLLSEVFDTPQGLEGITNSRSKVKLAKSGGPKEIVLTTKENVSATYLREVKFSDYVNEVLIPQTRKDNSSEEVFIELGTSRILPGCSGVVCSYNLYGRR